MEYVAIRTGWSKAPPSFGFVLLLDYVEYEFSDGGIFPAQGDG